MMTRWVVLGVLLSVVAGCSLGAQQEAYVEVLDAEKRWLEDELHHQRHSNEMLHRRLASCRNENNALRGELAKEEAAEGDIDDDEPKPPPIVLPEPIDSAEVKVELGLPDSVEQFISARSLLTGKRQSSADAQMPDDSRVARIVVDEKLTGGVDVDDQPGDDEISVVVQPQNIAGVYVPMSGPLSVVVVDPQEPSHRARLARWDFTTEETQRLMMESEFGQGIHLLMPWPNEPPRHPQLRLFVRYTTADGRKLEAEEDIHIQLPGSVSARWTPARLLDDHAPRGYPAPAIARGSGALGSRTRKRAPGQRSEFLARPESHPEGTRGSDEKKAPLTSDNNETPSTQRVPGPAHPSESQPTRSVRRRPQWSPHR